MTFDAAPQATPPPPPVPDGVSVDTAGYRVIFLAWPMEALAGCGAQPQVRVSAQQGTGLDALIAVTLTELGVSDSIDRTPSFFTDRQLARAARFRSWCAGRPILGKGARSIKSAIMNDSSDDVATAAGTMPGAAPGRG